MAKAIIWDMDGVISDTQKLHAATESQLLFRNGIIITPEEISARYSGVRTSDFFKDLFEKNNLDPTSIPVLMEEKWTLATALAHEHVDAIPGAIDLIHEAYRRGVHQAVASASPMEYVRTVLTTLGVHRKFNAIVSGDLVSKGKPDPEIFLKAAQLMGEDPSDCVVIEDGVPGMIGAKRAVMYSIGLRSQYTQNTFLPADTIVGTLEGLTIDKILSYSAKN